MKKLFALFTLFALSTTTQSQAAEFQSPNKPLRFEIRSAQYDGRAPYTEVFEFIKDNHLDLVDTTIRRQWTDRWQPSNVSPTIFQSRQATEKAIKDMMHSLNRKHDFFLSREDTARQQAWLNATNTVRTSMLANNIAYVKIPSFLPKTIDRETQIAIANCSRAQALIIDLRGNTGGLVQPALNVAAMLIPEGLIYIARARENDQVEQTTRSLEKTRWVTITSGTTSNVTEYAPRTQLAIAASVPLVVLVDGKTASAAELLTGALKQSRRAIIIGTRTYGKGTGNKLTLLHSNGRSLQVTHEDLMPGGLKTDGNGILPDVDVNQVDGSVDYQLQAAIAGLSKSTPTKPTQAAQAAPTDSPKKTYGGSPYVRLY